MDEAWAQQMQPETESRVNESAEPMLTHDERRVNGFTKGDRVAIVSGSYKGAYGKVEHSSTGCRPEWCGKLDGGNCRIVYVDLTHIPKEVAAPSWMTSKAFRVSEVTHID